MLDVERASTHTQAVINTIREKTNCKHQGHDMDFRRNARTLNEIWISNQNWMHFYLGELQIETNFAVIFGCSSHGTEWKLELMKKLLANRRAAQGNRAIGNELFRLL